MRQRSDETGVDRDAGQSADHSSVDPDELKSRPTCSSMRSAVSLPSHRLTVAEMIVATSLPVVVDRVCRDVGDRRVEAAAQLGIVDQLLAECLDLFECAAAQQPVLVAE